MKQLIFLVTTSEYIHKYYLAPKMIENEKGKENKEHHIIR